MHWTKRQNGYHCFVYDSAIPNQVLLNWLQNNTSGYYESRIHYQGGDECAEITLSDPADAMMFKLNFQNYSIA